MAIFAGIIAAGAAVAGDMMAQSGQESTNDANAQIHQTDNNAALQRQQDAQAFNSREAGVARDFSAQQVAQQEAFQQSTQQEAERYNTEMSNTSMQRRMADLRAAGINPMLAVSQGGASTPTISSLSGGIGPSAAASSGAAGAPGAIPMQNTSAAFGNLGGQMSNAASAATIGANIDLLKAQTSKLNAESGQEIPAQVNYLKSMTGLTDQNASQAYYNTQLIQEKIYGQRLDNDQLRDITTPMQGQRLDILKATRDALVSSTESDATAKALQLQGLRNLNDVQQGNLGKILTYLNALLQPVGSAAKAAGAVGLEF